MRARALAGVAVAAWSKTAMIASTASTASASPIHTDVPTPPPVTVAPVPPTCGSGPIINGPTASGLGSHTTVEADVFSQAPYKTCPAANLSLDATSDNIHWKRLDSIHVEQTTGAQTGSVSSGCLPGNWTYRVLSAADDGSYKNSQRAAFAC